MKELCYKYGNGICTTCQPEFKSTVLCRNTIATYTEYNRISMEDMIFYMIRKGLFDTEEELLKYFEI